MQTVVSGGVPVRLDAVEADVAGRRPAIVLLHGAGGNIDFWLDRIAPFIARLEVSMYAVHYFDRTGTVRADAATIMDGRNIPLWLETIRDALRHVASRPVVDTERIGVIGISLGAFLALALGTNTKRQIKAIVEISGGLAEPYAAQATEQFPPTLILHGDQDAVVGVEQARALDSLLTKLQVEHQLEILKGEGHWFSPSAQLRILGATAAFLGKHLEIRTTA